MRTPYLFLSAVLGACGGGTYNQGGKIVTEDTSVDDTGSDQTEDTGDETEDTAENEDTGDTEDTDIPEACINNYHPIHIPGWSKTFTAEYEGSTSTVIIEGLGETDWNGETLYAYHDQNTDSEGLGWDVTSYVRCDEELGLLLVGWSGTYSAANALADLGFPPDVYNIDATLTPPRNYLPPEFAVGGIGSWDMSYNLNMNIVGADGTPQQQVRLTEGDFQEVGAQNPYDLPNGDTVEAYKVNISFTVTETSNPLASPSDGYIEQYWVKGLGMVKETYINPADQSIILSKELSSYSGISPIE